MYTTVISCCAGCHRGDLLATALESFVTLILLAHISALKPLKLSTIHKINFFLKTLLYFKKKYNNLIFWEETVIFNIFWLLCNIVNYKPVILESICNITSNPHDS